MIYTDNLNNGCYKIVWRVYLVWVVSLAVSSRTIICVAHTKGEFIYYIIFGVQFSVIILIINVLYFPT